MLKVLLYPVKILWYFFFAYIVTFMCILGGVPLGMFNKRTKD